MSWLDARPVSGSIQRCERRITRGEGVFLALDCENVTHYGAKLYLSMVDCGPSRFAIWQRLLNESAASIIAHLREVLFEGGPCDELLDNSIAFRSATIEQFADEWGISLRFRAAYAPSGNGIVERNHRTIKRIAARGGISPEEATFWYNVTPRKETEAGSVQSSGIFRYRWRVPFDVNLRVIDGCENNSFAVGDKVWVKPPLLSCTKQWTSGEVTGVVSKHAVCVDGIPRHVRDVRKRRFGGSGARFLRTMVVLLTPKDPETMVFGGGATAVQLPLHCQRELSLTP